jgi:hypothetical protein
LPRAGKVLEAGVPEELKKLKVLAYGTLLQMVWMSILIEIIESRSTIMFGMGNQPLK